MKKLFLIAVLLVSTPTKSSLSNFLLKSVPIAILIMQVPLTLKAIFGTEGKLYRLAFKLAEEYINNQTSGKLYNSFKELNSYEEKTNFIDDIAVKMIESDIVYSDGSNIKSKSFQVTQETEIIEKKSKYFQPIALK